MSVVELSQSIKSHSEELHSEERSNSGFLESGLKDSEKIILKPMIRFSQSDNEALNKRAFINNQDSLNDLRLNILRNMKEQARFEREIEAKDHI